MNAKTITRTVKNLHRMGMTFRRIDRVVFGLRNGNGTKSYRVWCK